jgi:L-ribulose-5-phosphate 3-epimerase
LKIGCNTVAFRKYPLEFALDKIAAAGYEYVEVEANLSWCPHADPWKDDPVQFKDHVARRGFKGVSALGSHRELISSEEGVRDIERALEWCHAAGVPVVLTGEGRLPANMTIPQALDVLKGRLEHLAQVAETNRVYLALEDHGSISLGSLDGLPRILDLVKSDWVGVNFDTANIHRGDYVGTDRGGYEWKLGAATSFSEVELAKRVGKRIKHVHFKDVRGRISTVLGEGEIDLVGCLRIFKDAGYEGVLSYETEGWEEAPEAEVMIAKSKQFMTQALASL